MVIYFIQPYINWNVELKTFQLVDIFRYSHHLSGWYCIDTVRRNSVLVTHGSRRVKEEWNPNEETRALSKTPLTWYSGTLHHKCVTIF